MKTPESEELISLRGALSEALRAYREQIAKRGGDLKVYRRLHEDVLAAERKLALALGDEAAIPWELPFRSSSFSAIKLSDDGRTILIFEASAASKQTTVALSFDRTLNVRHGWPNDEAIGGHRLYGKGLCAHGYFEVENSKLIQELELGNRVHPSHKPEHHRGYKHYLLSFQDETIEIVSKEVSHETFEEDVMLVVPKLLSRLQS